METVEKETKGENSEKGKVNKNEILDNTQSISSVSQEISASAEELSASTQEVTAVTINFLEYADKLKGLANELSKLIEIFKI